ncbi:MAG TPA: hypothetical protein PKU85_04050 [Bacteroidales bacterium]|nr:MAG: Sporulation related domain protein [Bacteroidetes bacterium ADurb.Bin037]HPV88366.1 hypothetical protein [Bacteroidales bacterium]HPW78003.1 hypothetical protein [Bacteroidales bacterium]HQB55305.1 hypothetical protein [Bacteroidales bacterium]
MVNKLLIKACLIAGLLFPASVLYAQLSPADALFREGERLRKAYEFERAKEAFIRATSLSNDSLLIAQAEQRRVLCENGMILSNYIVRPLVLGRTVIPLHDFVLHYDLAPSGSWVFPPLQLLAFVNDDGQKRQPMLYRQSLDRLVFAARDTTLGTGWDIYMICKKDTLSSRITYWDPPVRLGPGINTSGNEVYPVLSADGNTLFFSSDGLAGMGDRDLFTSSWNSELQQWEPAQNMGIPFSSTSDDLLYILSDDPGYFYFASDRAAPKDSLILYKVEYESSPVKIKPSSVQELQQIASLPPPHLKLTSPKEETTHETARQLVHDTLLQETRQAIAHYADLIGTVRNFTDQVTGHEWRLDSLRRLYGSLSREEDRLVIANTIREEEIILMELQQSLRDARKSAQSIEDLFLSHGVLPPVATPASTQPAPAHDPPQQEAPFNPVRQKYVNLENHIFEAPVPVIPPVDLTFRIEKESVIVPWENEPKGLYYRIQLFTVVRKAVPGQLKGICPVFEVRAGSRYVYYAGQFNSYADASKALTLVKKQNISGAIIVAYYQGKSISVQEGRRREAQNKTAPEGIKAFQVYLGSNEIPPGLVSLVNEFSDKDIIRVIAGTGADYFIGPFNSMEEAQALAAALQEKGYVNVTVQPVTK